jgi:glycosyltransferase involved in cell wall biosynthesis
VNVSAGYLAGKIDDYYLVVGQFVDYKRIDLAIAACNQLGRRLHIVGEGEQYKSLRKLAGPSIHFCGSLSDEDLREQYAHCRALLFPGEEDFGIVPVEAMSFGRPVIAFGSGGVKESVNGFYSETPGDPKHSTGVFFREQTSTSLLKAILSFEIAENRFSPFYIKQQSERFSPAHFRRGFGTFLFQKFQEFQADCENP